MHYLSTLYFVLTALFTCVFYLTFGTAYKRLLVLSAANEAMFPGLFQLQFLQPV